MAHAVARPHRLRCGAVVPREAVLGAEPAHVGGLGHDLGRGERTHPGKRDERGSENAEELGDLPLQGVGSHRELADAPDEVRGDPCDGALEAPEALGDRVQVREPHEDPRRRIPCRIELVQVPAQTVDLACALPDEVLAVIDEQSQLTARPVQACHGQIGLAPCSSRHREGIDRIGLAVGARGVACMRHKLRWHPHDLLTGTEQVGLQAPGQMPAVLHGESALGPEPVGPPK